jgi:hypothetical protein
MPDHATAAALLPHCCCSALQALYKSKVVTDQAAGQWRKPCPFELQAALQTMINTATSTTGTKPTTTTTGSGGAAAVASDSSEGGNGPVRQSSSSSSGSSVTDSEEGGVSQGSLFSSTSLDSGVMNNAGVMEGGGEGKTELAVIFLLDSSGSVGDGECGVGGGGERGSPQTSKIGAGTWAVA